MQSSAVSLFIKPRTDQDPTKAEEFQKAVLDLARAHGTFIHLKNLGIKGVRVGIDDNKLDQHILFCHQTHTKAAQVLQTVKTIP